MADNATFNELRVSFTPEFGDFITLYRGVERVWISGAPYVDPQDENKDGILFAEMEDGTIQTIGPVSAYFYAQKNGFTGTFSEWVQVLLDATQNALTAEGYAKGTHNGTAVPSTDEAYKKHSKYYSESSESWAVGTRAGSTDSERSGASTNNSKYWAGQSKTYTDGKDLNGNAVRGTNNAKYWAEDRAKKWAVKSTNSGNPGDTNCSEYYASQASSSASTAATLANSVKGATIDITYMNSDDGRNHPSASSSDWNATPNPVSGKYMWTKMVLTWTDTSTSTMYSVSYIGVNGTGSVHSVNGKVGNVTLYATDIAMSSSDSATISDKLTAITNNEIDALFT